MTSIKNALTASMLSVVVLGAATMAAQERAEQRTQSYYFAVTALGSNAHDLGSWSKATGLDVSWDIAEYRSGGAANASLRYFPGITKYGTVTLTRSSSSEAERVIIWLEQIAATFDPPTLLITLIDQTGDPVARWQLDNVFPQKYTVGGLNASGTDVAIETLVLSHEGLRVVCERAC